MWIKIVVIWTALATLLLVINKRIADRNKVWDEQSEQLLASLQRLEDGGK